MNIVGFEHLHRHTDFSLLDGFATVEEYARRSLQINQKYLCISDHGMLGAIPRQIKACDSICDKHGKGKLSPIFACELYVNRMQKAIETVAERDAYMAELNEKERKEFKQWGAHLLAIAYNNIGYQNLVRLSSWGYVKGHYYRPRVNYEMLKAHREGLIFTSCCYNSEVGRAFEHGGEEAASEMIERYMEMFPPDKDGRPCFYLELMLLDFIKQKPYDQFIIKAHEKYRLPLIVTNDCHYCQQEDSHYQRIMLMVQTGRTIKEIQEALAEDSMQDFFELQDANLWMKSEEEMNLKWEQDYRDIIPLELFEEAKRNTVKICEQAKGVVLDRRIKLPRLPDADERLLDLVKKGAMERGIRSPVYAKRIQEEISLICRKDFASYFLIQKMMTDEARRYAKSLGWGDGTEAVGPGRGSAVGSLVCYCLGITDVDPIHEDLLFSRFMSEARGGRQMQLRFKNIDPLPPEDMVA
jgi:DNA polymerase-3 subunit alpha